MRFDRLRSLCLGITSLLLPLVFSPTVVHAASRPKPGSISASDARRAVIGAARSWAYQLRIYDLAPLASVDADVLVVDHGFAARRDGKILFDPAEVARLKVKPNGGRRIVLAYMSIGEAEQYRFYWQAAWCSRATAPSWIGAVNPNWPGNYPARFWDPDWQQIILAPETGYLAHIQAQGFDGVYLDRTDVYSEWLKERPAAEQEMMAFLGRIASTARQHDQKFLIVMQNTEELLVHSQVRRLLDGVAKEDLLFGVAFTETANDPDTIRASLGDLRRARADHMPVFAVEYLTDPGKIADARKRLADFGFVPYFAPRLLDRLMPQPGSAAPVTPPSPAVVPSAGAPPAPGPSWAEGGPTCLRD